jgi:hypothetical protein
MGNLIVKERTAFLRVLLIQFNFAFYFIALYIHYVYFYGQH